MTRHHRRAERGLSAMGLDLRRQRTQRERESPSRLRFMSLPSIRRHSPIRRIYKKRTTALTTKYPTQVNDAAAAAGVSCAVIHVEHEHPYRAIIDAANKNGCDLIAMASHGRHGISVVVLGSETVKVLTHSNIAVLVYR